MSRPSQYKAIIAEIGRIEQSISDYKGPTPHLLYIELFSATNKLLNVTDFPTAIVYKPVVSKIIKEGHRNLNRMLVGDSYQFNAHSEKARIKLTQEAKIKYPHWIVSSTIGKDGIVITRHQ